MTEPEVLLRGGVAVVRLVLPEGIVALGERVGVIPPEEVVALSEGMSVLSGVVVLMLGEVVPVLMREGMVLIT